jgi:hypothetical protein
VLSAKLNINFVASHHPGMTTISGSDTLPPALLMIVALA